MLKRSLLLVLVIFAWVEARSEIPRAIVKLKKRMSSSVPTDASEFVDVVLGEIGSFISSSGKDPQNVADSHVESRVIFF